MPKRRVDLLVHLKLSDGATDADAERADLFDLDEQMENLFGAQFDGNDIGEGEFLLHFVPKGDPETLLKKVLRAIPQRLLRTGSYAVVRVSQRDEMTERVIPITGTPKVTEVPKARKALSFGLITGGNTELNTELRSILDGAWKQVRAMADRGPDDASLIVIWYLGGDISSPDEQREKVRIENRAERVLGGSVEIPIGRRSSDDARRCFDDALNRVIELAEGLVARRKLGWNLNAARAAVTAVRDRLGDAYG